MRFLVTGCAGFIGSNLSDSLLAAGHEVVGIDRFAEYYDPQLKRHNLAEALQHPEFSLTELDLSKDPIPTDLCEVDGVFHLAAQAGVRASWGKEFATYTDDNILATQRLLEAMVNSETMPRIVYSSSSSIYGNALSRPTLESALPAPVSPYGVTKLAAEHLCESYAHNFGVETVSLRYFTVYGPRQRPDMAFNRFIRSALTGATVYLYGDGEQSRDFTFIADIVAANIAAMNNHNARGAYNIGGGSTITVNEILALISEVSGCPIDIHREPRQLGDVLHTSADTSRAQADLGFAPTVTLADGIAREIDWMRSII